MNRREFLTWTLAYFVAIGWGRQIGKIFYTPSPVTILDVPDYQNDFHRDLVKIMKEDKLNLTGKNVLLKPNFVEVHEGRPINTDVRFIQQVAEACFVAGAKSVTVGEAAGHRRDAWYSVHNPKVRETLGKRVKCLDMNHGPVTRLRNRSCYTTLSEFFVATPILEADVVISLPKMKTHHWVGVTLSIKNLFGVLPGIFYGWPKNVLHIQGIENSIIDIFLSIPVHYTVVDGIVGMEGDGPILGTAKHVGAVIAGPNLLAVDATVSRMMGFDPLKIYYLLVASFFRPGILESQIVYRGEHPKKFATQFACLDTFKKCRGGPFW